jgi:hypothetical protein
MDILVITVSGTDYSTEKKETEESEICTWFEFFSLSS